MREILFKAKIVDNGEWETGSIVVIRGGCSDESVYIADKMTGYLIPVIPETVGQFTGLYDKSGKKIFEGDIVKFYFRYGANREKTVNENLIVKWSDKYLSYEFSKSKWDACFIKSFQNDYEVIGNIHTEEY